MAPDTTPVRRLSRDLFQVEWLLGDLIKTSDGAQRQRIRNELSDLARRLRAGAPALREATATARLEEQRHEAARDIEAVAGEIEAVAADSDPVSGQQKAQRLLEQLRLRATKRFEPRRSEPAHTLRILGPRLAEPARQGDVPKVTARGSPGPAAPHPTASDP
jgi:tRNA(Ile)-lysidine synthase TilS/MesJ